MANRTQAGISSCMPRRVPTRIQIVRHSNTKVLSFEKFLHSSDFWPLTVVLCLGILSVWLEDDKAMKRCLPGRHWIVFVKCISGEERQSKVWSQSRPEPKQACDQSS